ncbi:unnamed protein product [Sphagnum troendelagicum]|uniref:Zinc finger protein 830 n=1 Tax=Sphagnum troendelagicum TaxID=128251 RepID=A0ABP0U6J5_9BRYO
MDKKLMRARMKEATQKREKRITSPLVRYNELDQAVCKVCNVVIKSEALWGPHLVSRSHKEAAEQIKARAARATTQVSTKAQTVSYVTLLPTESKPSVTVLPSDFFDSPTTPNSKRLRSNEHTSLATQAEVSKEQSTNQKPAHNSVAPPTVEQFVGPSSQMQNMKFKEPPVPVQEGKSSTLPEGFFDSVDADHRARGLEPPKLDIKDEWKEFQKTIREDLHEVDFRQEAEEYEAAEEREQREQLEQRTISERIEMFRKQKREKAAKAKAVAVFPAFGHESDDSLSEESDEDVSVDWRAKQI